MKFQKKYRLGKAVSHVHIRTSGDTFFRLYINGEHKVTGPASYSEDFLEVVRKPPQHYATETELDLVFKVALSHS